MEPLGGCHPSLTLQGLEPGPRPAALRRLSAAGQGLGPTASGVLSSVHSPMGADPMATEPHLSWVTSRGDQQEATACGSCLDISQMSCRTTLAPTWEDGQHPLADSHDQHPSPGCRELRMFWTSDGKQGPLSLVSKADLSARFLVTNNVPTRRRQGQREEQGPLPEECEWRPWQKATPPSAW